MLGWLSEWVATPLIIIVLIAILTRVWNLGSWTSSVNKDLEALKDRAEDDRSVLREFMTEIRTDVKNIFRAMQFGMTERNSRVQLNERGKKASEDLEASRWAATHLHSLVGQCQDLPEHRTYALCRQYVDGNSSNWPENADEVAYDLGTPRAALAEVLTIVLRDEILRELEETSS